jgi:hypothetical protein
MRIDGGWMDSRRFDSLVRALGEAGTRRGLLGLLATLPVLSGLFALLDHEETDAKGRRKRRKKRHKHGKGRHKGKHKKPKCKPHSKAKTCAGKCGPVRNNCKKSVDCGSCACDPLCDECHACDETAQTCFPADDGEPCGEPGQVCQSGVCACTNESCPTCTTCEADGTCGTCDGCCDGETCVADCGTCRVCDEGQCTGCPDCCDTNGDCQDGERNAACGSSGTCDICTGQEECQDQRCVCVPDCDGKVCGDDGCTGTCEPGCPADSTCTDGGTICLCDFVTCDSACCPAGESCCDDGCANLESNPNHCGACGNACGADQVCQGGVCGVACGSDFCPATSEICVNDVCQACTVTCTGTPAECGAVLQLRLDAGGTHYVCPGTYRGGFHVNLGVTVIGAGEGDDERAHTILHGNDELRVVDIVVNGAVTFERLRVSHGLALSGAGVSLSTHGTLVMRDSTVSENNATDGRDGIGGGIRTQGSLELERCTIRDNHAPATRGQGGGIAVAGPATLTDCLLTENTTTNEGGAIFVSSDVDSVLTLNTCTVTDNGANDGGGLWIAPERTATLNGGSVTGNHASNTGNDIFNRGTLAVNGAASGECCNVDLGTGCPAGACA